MLYCFNLFKLFLCSKNHYLLEKSGSRWQPRFQPLSRKLFSFCLSTLTLLFEHPLYEARNLVLQRSPKCSFLWLKLLDRLYLRTTSQVLYKVDRRYWWFAWFIWWSIEFYRSFWVFPQYFCLVEPFFPWRFWTFLQLLLLFSEFNPLNSLTLCLLISNNLHSLIYWHTNIRFHRRRFLESSLTNSCWLKDRNLW